MKTIISILAATFIAVTAFAQSTEKIIDQYILVKDALVKSDSKATATYVAALQKEIQAAPTFKEKDALLKSVQKMAKATDLEKQRTAFAEVSDWLWKSAKTNNHLKQDIYYQYCPMKKTYWLSKEAAIKNPYYGSKMLTCGNVADKKLN